MFVMSCLRKRRSCAAAITSDDTNEQSVMIVCVIVSADTRKIIFGSPRMNSDGRAHRPKWSRCSLFSASVPSGSLHGSRNANRSRC